MKVKTKLLIGLALFGFLGAQQGDVLPRNEDTHQNPACSITGSRNSVRCSCVRMVAQVQTFFTERCWTDFGWKKIDGPDDRQAYWAKPPREFTDAENPPDDVRGCLAKVPDHCRVIAKVQGAWQAEGVKLDTKDGCGTGCRPELCICLDGACKAHGEGAGY